MEKGRQEESEGKRRRDKKKDQRGRRKAGKEKRKWRMGEGEREEGG